MSTEITKTAFIAGHEMDASTVRFMMDALLPSVQRVAEAMAIAGHSEEEIQKGAIATANAVSGAMIQLLTLKSVATL